MKKILWVDFDHRTYLKGTIEQLTEMGFEIQELPWRFKNGDVYTSKEVSNMDVICMAARQVDYVMIHFGSMSRGKASELLHKIKESGTPVVVNSASIILFEGADRVIELPFRITELVEILDELHPQ